MIFGGGFVAGCCSCLRPPVPNAIRLVALGDSIMHAIGADKPDDGIAGRIAAHRQHRTGSDYRTAGSSILPAPSSTKRVHICAICSGVYGMPLSNHQIIIFSLTAAM